MDLPRYSLKGKVALVTGGSRGIGEATAIEFAKAGADVAVASRKLNELERVAGVVRKLGRKALAVEAHIGHMNELQPVVDKVVKEFGTIDILVNNSGNGIAIPAMEMTEKAYDSLMGLNLKGLYFLSQAVARVMKAKGSGTIINVASVAGINPEVPNSVYSISKAGVIMATKAMAVEWAQYNIRVNAIAPGPIDTYLFMSHYQNMPDEATTQALNMVKKRVPLRRIGVPHEIADAMVFFASDASSFVTGQTLTIDGGLLLR